jgi:hypothetical protein
MAGATRPFGAICLVALTFLAACSSREPAPIAQQSSAITTVPTFTMPLPSGVQPTSVALAAAGNLQLQNSDTITKITGGYAAIANAGTGLSLTQLGAADSIGPITSVPTVTVGLGSVINGNALSAGQVVVIPTATVTGTTTANAPLTVTSTLTWTPPTPAQTASNVTVSSGTTTLPPGTYGTLSVLPGATVSLQSGVYFFSTVIVPPLATLQFNGPTVAYVTSAFNYEGAIADTQGTAQLLIAYSGALPININAAFRGTIVAPNALLTLFSYNYVGSFYAQNINVLSNASIEHQPFPLPPSPCLGVSNGVACSTGSGSGICEGGQCANVSCNDANAQSGATQSNTVSANFGDGVVSYQQTVSDLFGT